MAAEKDETIDLPVVVTDAELDDGADRVYPPEYEGHFEFCVLKHEDILKVVRALAKKLHDEYKGKRPLMLCTLKGANPFYQNLLEALQELRQGYYMEFLKVSTYYSGTESSGKIELGGGFKFENLKDKDVIIVEDMIDSGTTLSQLVPLLKEKAGPRSVEVCTILARNVPNSDNPPKYAAKFVGFSVQCTHWLGGYGLDLDEKYRDCRDVWALSEEGKKCPRSKLPE